jgi:hypothetical protein
VDSNGADWAAELNWTRWPFSVGLGGRIRRNTQVSGFRDLAEQLAPEVVAIPYCQVLTDGSVIDEEITEFYRAMRTVSEDYAKRVRWRG